jgi:hypothetical protein
VQPAEAVRVVAYLKAGWPHTTIEPETVQVYAELLLDLEAPDAMAAARWLAMNATFFPALSEVRRAAGDFKRTRLDAERQLRAALPPQRWTEEDEAASRETLRELLADWRARHPHGAAPADVVKVDDSVVEEGVAFDPADVQRKREAAREMAAAIGKDPNDPGLD